MRQGDLLCWVYSTSTDTPKVEFTPPEHSPLYTGQTNETYIEAVDDERFGICFGVPSDAVRQHGADAVCVELDIDRGATSLALVLRVRDQSTICEKIDSFTCLKEGTWQDCGFAFRKMNLDEDLILTHEEAGIEAKAFGTIRVTIMRGHALVSRDKNEGIIPSTNRRLEQHTSSKRIIKDSGISHSINTPVLRSLPNRRGVPLKFAPLRHPNFHVASFVFKYRSQMSLELKKVIGDEQAIMLEESRHTRSLSLDDLSTERTHDTKSEHGVAQIDSHATKLLKREKVDVDDTGFAFLTDTVAYSKRRKSVV